MVGSKSAIFAGHGFLFKMDNVRWSGVGVAAEVRQHGCWVGFEPKKMKANIFFFFSPIDFFWGNNFFWSRAAKRLQS